VSCERRSTREVSQDSRFDFWRRLFTAPVLEHPLEPGLGGFHGELRRVVTSDGTGYSNLRADSHLCRFGEHDTDVILFGLVRNGSVSIQHGRDDKLLLRPESGVVLFDCGRSLTTRSSCSVLTYLTLPRATVATAIGCDPVPRGVAARLLSAGPLVSSLGAYLRQFEHDGVLNTVKAAGVMHVAKALALVTLANVQHRRRWWSNELDDALYTVACHQLGLRLADPKLTAARIAQMLGCSRAHLYRLFAARDETVAGRLRGLRMQRAAALFERHSGASVGMVSWACGYTDLSAFGKAFRRAFGLAPNAWCAERCGTPCLPRADSASRVAPLLAAN
jgi:AraC-like DNA-binding protein